MGVPVKFVVEPISHSTRFAVELKHHFDKVGPLSTLAFTTRVRMIITRVAEILEERGTQLYIHPLHNVPGDETAYERLSKALYEYEKRAAVL